MMREVLQILLLGVCLAFYDLFAKQYYIDWLIANGQTYSSGTASIGYIGIGTGVFVMSWLIVWLFKRRIREGSAD